MGGLRYVLPAIRTVVPHLVTCNCSRLQVSPRKSLRTPVR